MTKKKKTQKHHDTGFLGLLVLFIGFSSYAVASFFTSTNQQVKYLYSSVLDNEGQVVEQEQLPPREELFVDVNSNHQNYDAIKALHNLGVVGGYSDDTFKPDKVINRAEMLAMLTNAVDADFSEGVYKDCFADVRDDWFSVFVCYAKDSGWVAGYDNGRFLPMEPATKAESLVALFRAFDYQVCDEVLEQPYQDVSVDEWLAPFACAAKRDYLFTSDEVFAPGYQLTRADLVQLLYNVMSKLGRV